MISERPGHTAVKIYNCTNESNLLSSKTRECLILYFCVTIFLANGKYISTTIINGGDWVSNLEIYCNIVRPWNLIHEKNKWLIIGYWQDHSPHILQDNHNI